MSPALSGGGGKGGGGKGKGGKGGVRQVSNHSASSSHQPDWFVDLIKKRSSFSSGLLYALSRLADNQTNQRRNATEWMERALAHATMVSEHRRAERDAIVAADPPLAKVPLSDSFYGGMMLAPTFSCPMELVKSNSDLLSDGGKWLCGLDLLLQQRACVVYSIGSNFDISFESYVAKRAAASTFAPRACAVHIYDPTMVMSPLGPAHVASFRADVSRRGWWLHETALASADNSSSVSFQFDNKSSHNVVGARKGKALRTVTFPARSLREMFSDNGHECVDILKIDVEGMEGDLIPSAPWQSLCVGMLLIEVHGQRIEHLKKAAQRANTTNSLAAPRAFRYTVGRALADIHILERAGFALYSSEMVCRLCPGAAELAFVNVSWLRTMTLDAREAGTAVSASLVAAGAAARVAAAEERQEALDRERARAEAEAAAAAARAEEKRRKEAVAQAAAAEAAARAEEKRQRDAATARAAAAEAAEAATSAEEKLQKAAAAARAAAVAAAEAAASAAEKRRKAAAAAGTTSDATEVSTPAAESSTLSKLWSLLDDLDSSAETMRGRGKKKADKAGAKKEGKVAADDSSFWGLIKKSVAAKFFGEPKPVDAEAVGKEAVGKSAQVHSPRVQSPQVQFDLKAIDKARAQRQQRRSRGDAGGGEAPAGLAAAAVASKRTRVAYKRHANRNCYPGMGAVALGETHIVGEKEAFIGQNMGATSQAVLECMQQCTRSGGHCTGVTVLARPKRKKEKKAPNCFFRKDVELGLCPPDVRFDTYVRE